MEMAFASDAAQDVCSFFHSRSILQLQFDALQAGGTWEICGFCTWTRSPGRL